MTFRKVFMDSELDDDSKAGRLVAPDSPPELPLSFDPDETLRIKQEEVATLKKEKMPSIMKKRKRKEKRKKKE